MPELPEVETNRRNLRAWALGRTIVRVTPPPGTRETGGASARAFASRLRGRRVDEVERRGKWIVVRLSGGAGLGLHLGMTGKIAHHPPGGHAEPPRFTRAAFDLDDGTRVFFVDSRRFGKLLAEPDLAELLARRELAEVGPDALDEAELDAATFAERLGRTRRTIKEALLDQRLLAGVGNIYATEGLWHARIHPATPASVAAADRRAVGRLLSGVRKALRQGLIEYQDTELPVYIEEGGTNPFQVYARKGEPCPRCRTPVEAIGLGGRTSAYCPVCQQKPRI